MLLNKYYACLSDSTVLLYVFYYLQDLAEADDVTGLNHIVKSGAFKDNESCGTNTGFANTLYIY